MSPINRKAQSAKRSLEWLPDMDLNHDKQIQSLLCYRYTIGQTGAPKLEGWPGESRLHAGIVGGAWERGSVGASERRSVGAALAHGAGLGHASTLRRFHASTL